MINKEDAINYIRLEYRRLDKITKVNTEGIVLKLSSRLTRKYGYFQVQKKSVFSSPELSITISTAILKYDDVFLDVIRHEYAHAVVYLRYPRQNHGHDKVWRAVCGEVGCTPRATRKAIEEEPVKQRAYKYAVRCCRCGAETRYKTESNAVKIVRHKKFGTIFCRRCGSRSFAVIDL